MRNLEEAGETAHVQVHGARPLSKIRSLKCSSGCTCGAASGVEDEVKKEKAFSPFWSTRIASLKSTYPGRPPSDSTLPFRGVLPTTHS